MPKKPETVVSRSGELRGVRTGAEFRCQLTGCTGMRLTTKWPDGRITHPCSKGMNYDPKKREWRIL